MSKTILCLDTDNVLVDFASGIPCLTQREREQYAPGIVRLRRSFRLGGWCCRI